MLERFGLSEGSLPRHVAIIMDGNGRWANARGLKRIEGHRRGADVVRDITTFARELGVEYLTLYSFSVQNWQRPATEVAGLMSLLREYCERERDTLMENEIQLATMGDVNRLPRATRKAVLKLKEYTANNRKMRLTLAIDYGGREELVKAVRSISLDVANGKLSANKIDAKRLRGYLDSPDLPDPDLVIRTSGELRVSNFLLWQIAYAELYFTDVYWPDFVRDDFSKALQSFAARQRRFGASQVDETPQVVASPTNSANARLQLPEPGSC